MSEINKGAANETDRQKYREKFQGKDRSEIERIFDELTRLAQDLTQEEKRYVREGFSSDEELPESYDELSVSAYRQEIYQYIYMRYKDVA